MLKPINPIQVFSPYWFDVGDRRFKSADPAMLYAQAKAADDTIVPYDQWYDIMIHRMCLELPKKTCRGDTEGDAYVKVLTWQDITGFVRAILAVLRTAAAGEEVYAEPIEAERRAFICSECSRNKQVSCAGCVGIISMADQFLRGRYAKGQANLGACKVCGCWLPAKIWCSFPVLKRILKKEDTGHYPENCWNRGIAE